MSYAPPVTFVDGNAVSYADFESNFAAWRTWVNAVANADISAAGIRRDQIVRPQIGGWPTQGSFGDAQSVAWDDYGDTDGIGDGNYAWGKRPNRITIVPLSLGRDRALTKFGRTLYLHDSWEHDVLIHVTGSAQVRTTFDRNSALTGPWYPDGNALAGSVANLGYLQMYRLDRAAGTETPYAAGRVQLYPPNYDNAVLFENFYSSDRFHVVYYERLAGGRALDFVLGYFPVNPTLGLQIDLTELTMRVEVS